VKKVPTLAFLADLDNMSLRPRAAEVSMAVGMIDYAQIDSMQIVPGARSTPDNSAIAFDWGSAQPRTVTRLMGYLTGATDATTKYQSALNNTVSLQVLGTGNVMRDKKSRAWNNATIAEVLADVTAGHRFNLVMDKHATRWARITQSNESDWSVVCRLSSMIGFWPFLNAATLYVLNPDTLATRQPVTSVLPTESSSINQTTRDLPQVGNAVISDRSGTFVDQTSGVVHSVLSDARVAIASGARPNTGRSDSVSITQQSYSEAQAVLEGKNRNAAWYIERTIEIDGRSDIKPLMPVLMPNPRMVRSNRLAVQQGWEEYDGIWLVKSVHANMKFQYDNFDYKTTLTVVRDARGTGLNVRQRRAEAFSFGSQPPTNLLNGQWASAWRSN
jgi:hypothetical protein